MLCKLICTCILMCTSAVLCAESVYDNQQSPTTSAFRHAPELLSTDEILQQEYAEFFIDESSEKALSIDDHAVTWIRIETNKKIKPENQKFLLIDNIGINDKESVSLYAVDSSYFYTKLSRNQAHAFPVFNLENHNKPTATYYLKFTNKSNYKLLIPVSFLSAEDLQEKLKIEYIIFGGMLFSLIILALYNTILFFFLKDITYLALTSILLSCILLLNRSSNIIGFIISFKEDTYYFYSLPMTLIVLIIFYFWKKILFIDKFYPKIGKTINYLFFINLALIPFMGIISSYEMLVQFQFFILFFILPFATFFISTKGVYIAKTLSVLMLVNTLGTIPIVFGGLGLIPTGNLVIKLYLFGVVIFGILMSLLQVAHTRQLRQQTEAAEAQRDAKDEFLRAISHELRTPMHAVISSGELLIDTPLNKRQQTYIQRLNIASAHMLSLIDDLLNLAKIEMVGGQQKNDEIYLPDLLSDVDVLLSVNAIEKNITLLIIDKSDLTDFLLLGDKKSLHQILINLIYNAIKYTSIGEVTLKITRTAITEDKNSADLLFEIHDTGIGISKKEQKKLFTPFYRIANQENKTQIGSGLGLVITQKLISLLGGNLGLESSPGAGTRFYFTLPFSLKKYEHYPKHAGSDTRHATELSVDISTIHILVVDDNELNRFFTEELLKAEGYHTDAASNGSETLSMLQKHSYDLIFLDLNMPDMTGFEVAKKIRKMAAWKVVPIIAFTASAIIDEKDHCLAAGMNDCVSKPLPFKELDEIIKKHLPT